MTADGATPAATTMPAWLKRIYAGPNALYAHGLGWVLGHRFVQVVSVGRRTGLTRRNIVEVIHYDPSTGEAIVIAGYGRAADWLRNVEAAGGARLDFGRGPRPAAYRIISHDEATVVWHDYARRNVLIRPGLHVTLTALLGWHFDGSTDAVLRMVAQLPMVAFTPAARLV